MRLLILPLIVGTPMVASAYETRLREAARRDSAEARGALYGWVPDGI